MAANDRRNFTRPSPNLRSILLVGPIGGVIRKVRPPVGIALVLCSGYPPRSTRVEGIDHTDSVHAPDNISVFRNSSQMSHAFLCSNSKIDIVFNATLGVKELLDSASIAITVQLRDSICRRANH